MRKSVGLVAAGVALAGMGVGAGWAVGAAGHPSTAATGVQTTTLGSDVATDAGFTGQLVSFASCSALLDALHARARDVVGPYGLSGSVNRYGGLMYGEKSSAASMAPAASPSLGRRYEVGKRGGLRRAEPLDHQHPGGRGGRAGHRQDRRSLPRHPRRPVAAHRRRSHLEAARHTRAPAAGKRTAAGRRSRRRTFRPFGELGHLSGVQRGRRRRVRPESRSTRRTAAPRPLWRRSSTSPTRMLPRSLTGGASAPARSPPGS